VDRNRPNCTENVLTTKANEFEFAQSDQRLRSTTVLIGTLGSIRRAEVEGGGVVVVNQGTSEEISVSLLIGADDRWYVPEREITTRQQLIRNTPIVSTSVRIPSGDAIATHFGAVQSQRELAVIDVENRSKVPFVAALVLRGPGVQDVLIVNNVLKVGGFPLLHLAKKPTKCAAVKRGGDLEALVTSGGATDVLPTIVGECEVAVLFPVTHGTTVRSALLLGVGNAAALAGTPVLSALGELHTLANGWQAQLRRSAVINTPNAELTKQFDAAAAALLLLAEPAIASGNALGVHDVTSIAQALTEAGLLAESGALLEDLEQRQGAKGVIADRPTDADATLQSALSIRALAAHALYSGDRVFAETMAPAIAGACEFVVKQEKKAPSEGNVTAALWWAAALFDVAGDPSAAKQARKQWITTGCSWPLADAPMRALPPISRGGALVASDPRRIGAIVRSAIDHAVRLRPSDNREADVTCDLVSGYTSAWRGQKVDVRNVAVPGGFLSFSLRWHGERPAILWDVVDTKGNTVTSIGWALTARSIDPTWSSAIAKGEDLLLR
jgi:hypothetical protein